MKWIGAIGCVVLIAGLLAAAPAAAFELPPWQSTLARDHPLSGALLDAAGGTVLRSEMVDEMNGADYVLLGETHDNADHHAIQAKIIEALVATGSQPAIVFEMVPQSMQPAVDGFLASATPDAAGFGDAVEWEQRGWPDWQIYRPIIETAIRNKLPVFGGNLARSTVRAMATQGVEAMGNEQRQQFAMDRSIGAAGRAALDDALFDGHCGLMPREHLAPMALAQKARDGAMAAAMRQAKSAGKGPVVLIAGSGHARRDFGVPTALAVLDGAARIVSLSLIEARDKEHAASGYIDVGSPVFDYVLVTPRAERDDPCEGLAERMGVRKQ